jgi:hypothetical protein
MADDAGFSTISISSRRGPYEEEREVESLLVRPPAAGDRIKAFLRYLSIFAAHFHLFQFPHLLIQNKISNIELNIKMKRKFGYCVYVGHFILIFYYFTIFPVCRRHGFFMVFLATLVLVVVLVIAVAVPMSLSSDDEHGSDKPPAYTRPSAFTLACAVVCVCVCVVGVCRACLKLVSIRGSGSIRR